MRRNKNITLNLKNITPHFTGKAKIITLALTIITLSFVNITFTSALSYQTYQRLDFTFNPTLQLTMSSTELTIPSLTPGASSDSNIINIGIATNTFGGLNLTATVGNSVNDTTSLVSHIDNNNPSNNPVFTNLSTTATTLNDLPNNTWGYSYASRDTSANPDAAWSSWSSYNGLIKYDDITSTPSTLLDTTGTATSGEVQFKIGAKASSAQPSGTYTNVINFNATTKPLTTTYTINYLDNTNEASAASLPPSATGTIVADTNVTLSSTIPTRSGGYTFMAWCTASTSNNTCAGNVYQPGETYPISNIGEPVTINLYAMWQGPKLYDVVASKVKTDANGNPRTQTLADLQAAITVPTSNDPATDTSNSGVYLYDATTYGTASDASNDYDIYYYRGVLDTNEGLGTYGSDGQADAYPNYVKLDNNTCWRIVRTTGSGGVKMVYNGAYKNDVCTNGGISAAPFNAGSWSGYTGLGYRNLHAAGYTYSNVAAGTITATSLSDLLGASGDDTTTNVNSSVIKQYIENWYTSNMATGHYASILEKSAGYCNDRTVYNNGSYNINNKLAENTMVIPYGTSNMTRYGFGAIARNWSASQNITLSCPRGKVDLYSAGSDNNGNGQLTYPIALLTADEASFAGSGDNGGITQYNANSYLRSGYNFWLLSPYFRYGDGTADGSVLHLNGYIYHYSCSYSYGVRPVISLMHHVQITSGTGIATDPYLISAP